MRDGLLCILIALLCDQKHRRVLPDQGHHTCDKDGAENERYSNEVPPGVGLLKHLPRGVLVDPRQGKVGHQSYAGSVETDAEGEDGENRAQQVRRAALLDIAEGRRAEETASYAIDQAPKKESLDTEDQTASYASHLKGSTKQDTLKSSMINIK